MCPPGVEDVVWQYSPAARRSPARRQRGFGEEGAVGVRTRSGSDREAHRHDHAHPHLGGRETQDRDALPRLGFIGAGRVGTALAIASSRAGWPVTAAASRDERRRLRFQSVVPNAKAYAEPAALLDDVEIAFLTVPDDAIPEVAARLRLYSGQALVHTSGLLPAAVLAPAMAAGTMIGSFHPLVAFADPERAALSLTGATIAIEGEEALLRVLAELAEALGAQPVRIPGDGKAAYHAGAVLAAGGFIGLLDSIAHAARGAGLDERGALAIYAGLIRQGLENAETLGIAGALTGPVVRGDVGTLRAHLGALARLAPAALPMYVAAAHREIALAVDRGDLSEERSRQLSELLSGGA